MPNPSKSIDSKSPRGGGNQYIPGGGESKNSPVSVGKPTRVPTPGVGGTLPYPSRSPKKNNIPSSSICNPPWRFRSHACSETRAFHLKNIPYQIPVFTQSIELKWPDTTDAGPLTSASSAGARNNPAPPPLFGIPPMTERWRGDWKKFNTPSRGGGRGKETRF